jgi:gluconate 2-dehydrogenase gamma chain
MSDKPESFEVRGSSFENGIEDGMESRESEAPTRNSNLETRTSPISRRAALKVLGAAPIIGVTAFVEQQQQQQQQTRQTHEAPNQPARDTKQPAPSPPRAKFFTQRELRTVRVLADDVIPRDERSGSARDANVAEFMDYNLAAEETTRETRVAWRGGLRWIDTESRRRFGVPYASATTAQRHQILDDIAWADRARPEMRYGTAFFARFRDMTAAGFFSSAIGFKDLQYIGNTFVPVWNGCPDAALKKLGVSYGEGSG